MLRRSFASLAKPLVVLAICSTFLAPAIASAADDPARFVEHLRARIVQDDRRETWSLAERMAHYGVPGVSVAIIEDGEIVWAAGYGVRQAGQADRVDADTVFSAGSVSKVATASLILRLAGEGQLDLDADIRDQLTSWTLPNERDVAPDMPVTLRAILSHTAGFNIHGFADFLPGEALPSTRQTLDGEAPAVNDALAREAVPASGYRYSGGGYTLAQLLVRDVAGESFEQVARASLFEPLELTRSSFANPLPIDHGNIAYAHDRAGEPTALPRGFEAMPEAAASGLWTSSRDLATLVATLLNDYQGADHLLSAQDASAMMTRVSPSEHGLGPRLTGRGAGFMFHHGGANNSYQAWIEGHLVTRDGLVILTNGSRGRALINEIRNAVADTMGWSINPPVIDPQLALPGDLLADYAGIYDVDSGFPVELREQMIGQVFDLDLEFRLGDAGLTLGVAGSEPVASLVALSPTRFAVPEMPRTVGIAEIEFHRNALGDVTGMSFHLQNASSHYRRQ